MRIWPALDLLDGATVQLQNGDPKRQHFSHPDPLAVAERWKAAGFERLHVIDLNAVLGRTRQTELLLEIRRHFVGPMQVGGGFRSSDAVREALDAGFDRVVIGSQAVLDPEWGRGIASTFPGRVVVAIEVRGGRVQTHGWTGEAPIRAQDLFALYEDAPLAALLCTQVDREGSLQGVDLEWAAAARRSTAHALCLAGGIEGLDDVSRLRELGIEEIIIGTALYVGGLDPKELIREFTS